MIQGVKHFPYQDRLRDLGLFRLENKGLYLHLRAAFQYLNGGYYKERDHYFSRVCCDRARADAFKVNEKVFRLGVRKKYDNGQEALHRLPREMVDTPFSDTHKDRLEAALSKIPTRHDFYSTFLCWYIFMLHIYFALLSHGVIRRKRD